ncbi:MAG: hypothetical protein PVH00_15855 [Gemmatimonadota bacterium]|jgi:hypothetical protein
MSNQNGSSGITGKLLMVVGLAAIAGLLWWLSRSAVPTTPAAMAEAPADSAAGEESMVPVVDANDFVNNETRYHGQEIDLGDVTVAQIMSPEIMWVELPGGAPFLVKLTPAAMAERPELQARVRIIGRVLEKTDSVLNAWEQTGAILDAGQRAQSEYGRTFIEATAIRTVGGM